MSSAAREKTSSLIRRLFFEFVVVFASVYSAFLLTEYREQVAERRTKLRYLETFREDLLRLDKFWRQPQVELVDSLLEYYEREIRKGNRPVLRVHERLDFTVNMLIIRSAFEPANFGTLTKEHLVSINLGSNGIALLEKRIDAYQFECRRWLNGPAVDQNIFYDRNGGLNPGMRWYVDDLKSIRHLLTSLERAIKDGAIPATDALIRQTLGD